MRGIITHRRVARSRATLQCDVAFSVSQLDYDPADAVRHLTTSDPLLGAVIERAGPLTLGLPHDVGLGVFQSLARSIVYQQLSGKAAATIFARMLAIWHPRDFPTPHELLGTSDEQLRAAGVSRNKALALRSLAEHALAGTVPEMDEARTLDDDELVRRLTVVRGIGRWTVEMLLIFRLGRPDVLPVADLGVRKGFQRTYGLDELPSAEQLTEHAELWRPYRSAASWYMWRAVEL